MPSPKHEVHDIDHALASYRRTILEMPETTAARIRRALLHVVNLGRAMEM
jgi:hypothetical protein